MGPMITSLGEERIRHAYEKAWLRRSRVYNRSVVCVVYREERAKVSCKWCLEPY